MKNNVTIIVYHYVREIKKSRYQGIKGLETESFKRQLSYLLKNHSLIQMDDLLESIHFNKTLPEDAALLTFDDAYLDHFTQVFPLLKKWGIQGSFYVPAKMIIENKVLNVNKIHFILALSEDNNKLIKRIFEKVELIRKQFEFFSPEELIKSYASANSYDSSDVMFIKRMLQKVLPQPFRNEMIEELFQETVRLDEESFSKELYVSKEQLEYMISSGMHIGNHTYSHPWLNTLSKEDQKMEINKCNEFLESLGVDLENWTMCFPYGGYNQETLNILNETNCKLGLTVNPGVANIKSTNYFELPRVDTNEINILS